MTRFKLDICVDGASKGAVAKMLRDVAKQVEAKDTAVEIGIHYRPWLGGYKGDASYYYEPDAQAAVRPLKKG